MFNILQTIKLYPEVTWNLHFQPVNFHKQINKLNDEKYMEAPWLDTNNWNLEISEMLNEE